MYLKIKILLILIILLCIGWVAVDINKSPMVGDWFAFIVMEFCAQVLLTKK